MPVNINYSIVRIFHGENEKFVHKYVNKNYEDI